MTCEEQAEELKEKLNFLSKTIYKTFGENANNCIEEIKALKAKIEAVRQGLQDDIECFGPAGDDIKRLHDCQEAIKKLDEVLE